MAATMVPVPVPRIPLGHTTTRPTLPERSTPFSPRSHNTSGAPLPPNSQPQPQVDPANTSLDLTPPSSPVASPSAPAIRPLQTPESRRARLRPPRPTPTQPHVDAVLAGVRGRAVHLPRCGGGRGHGPVLLPRAIPPPERAVRRMASGGRSCRADGACVQRHLPYAPNPAGI